MGGHFWEALHFKGLKGGYIHVLCDSSYDLYTNQSWTDLYLFAWTQYHSLCNLDTPSRHSPDNQLTSPYNPSDVLQTPPDTLQTSSRNHQDTLQVRFRHPWDTIQTLFFQISGHRGWESILEVVTSFRIIIVIYSIIMFIIILFMIIIKKERKNLLYTTMRVEQM